MFASGGTLAGTVRLLGAAPRVEAVTFASSTSDAPVAARARRLTLFSETERSWQFESASTVSADRANVVRAAKAMGVSDLDFVAVNDITDTKTVAHLLKYDSAAARCTDGRRRGW